MCLQYQDFPHVLSLNWRLLTFTGLLTGNAPHFQLPDILFLKYSSSPLLNTVDSLSNSNKVLFELQRDEISR